MLVAIGKPTTRENIAACAAVGASYWSGSRFKGCVWAVRPSSRPDVINEFVLVRIHRKDKTATIQGSLGGLHKGTPWLIHEDHPLAPWDTTPEIYVDPLALVSL